MNDSDKWNYFHDNSNNKGIVVNTFMSGIEEDELQLNVFVVDNPSSNDWHSDMKEIQECNCVVTNE
tara:strand:- start:241 stop:438 length:198 start_codon:yes stop_codon:yes gene_type:complete